MIKVLEVFGEPISNGGQESFVINVIQNMDRSGMQIDLLTPYYCDNANYQAAVQRWNGRVFELGLSFAPGKSRKKLLAAVYQFLKKNRYDVVHVHSGSISVLAYVSLAARLAGVQKIIVHSHCAGEKKTLKHCIIKTAAAPMLSLCPMKHCACSTVAGEYKYPSWIVKHRMKLIKNGVDLDVFRYDAERSAEMRRELGISKNTWVVGHVGRFSSQKNHSFLIKVFAALHQRNTDSVLLLIGNGDLMPEAQRQVHQMGLDSSVIFVGNVSNVWDYMQVMDVFVLPSKFEGLPIVMVEAQAAGVAVVASDAVTKETGLVDQVRFISLDAPLDDWVSAVENAASTPRFDEAERIRSKGFDIHSTAAEVRMLYKA